MRIIRHEPLPHRLDYKRRYHNDKLVEVTITRKQIENIYDSKEIWRTTKWLTEQTEHGCARLDYTVYCMLTKLTKRVLTNEEIRVYEQESTGLFKSKARELFTPDTYSAMTKYVFKCWKEYEKFNMLTFTKITYTKSFGFGRRRRSYTYRETAVKLTDKGKKVVV